ncbi:hypothetical protein [Lysinibacillus sp. 54212]|uniref:hypothetical protein n=1 Tax=Lysinibacillus sp. 54212 TaxID=3119829 RepID=UPI002FC94B0C
MAREFTMGARINLNTGSYSSSMSQAIRATQNFSEEVIDLDQAMGRYHDSSGRLREANGRFAASAGTASRQLEDQGKQATSLREKLFSLQGVITALAGSMAIKGAYNWLVGANADMEQYQNTLTVVLGSQEKAIAQLGWAEKFAAKTPFEIPEIIEATTRLESYGIESKKVLGITGDMASVMGKDLMQAVEAVADAQTGELERLKEFGITKGMLEEQAKLMGKNPVNKKGQITDQEAFNEALFALMEKRFEGGMEMQSKSFKGMISNAQDFMGSMGRKLGEPLFEKAKAGLQGFLDWLNYLEDSGAVDRFVASAQSGLSLVGKVVGAIAAPFKAIFDMMAGSGDQSYFVRLFGVEGASNFNNMLWDIVDGVKAFGSFAASAFGLAAGVLQKIGGVLISVGTYFLTNFPKFKPYIIGIATAFLLYFTYLKLVNTWSKIVAAAQLALNTVMSMNPVMLIVIAVGLLIGYLINLAGGWDVVKAKLLTFLPVLQQLWSKIVTAVMPILQKLGQVALSIFTSFKTVILPVIMTFINGVVAGFLTLVNWVRTHWSSISAIIQIAWAYISSYLMSGVEFVKIMIIGSFQYIATVLSGIWQIISGIVQVAWSIVSGLIGAGLAILRGDWDTAWQSMVDMLSGVWDGITSFFSGLKTLFFDSGKAILQTLADGIMAAASAPVDAVKSVLGKVREYLPFSDAKTGPLSNLTLNGSKILTTMAEGMAKQKNALTDAMNNALGTTPGVNVQAGKVNPAGSTATAKGGGSKQIIIERLIGELKIDAAGKDPKQLAEEIIAILFERLKNADEILSSAEMGVLLGD